MKKIMLLIGLFLLSVVSAEVGIDFNAEGNYYKVFNDYQDYYIDAETGIDLTNDYYNYWSKKEFCLEVKSGPIEGKKCVSEIPLDWTTEENEFYVKLIGNLDFLGAAADFNLVYYLGLTDERLTITPQTRTKKKLDYLKFSVKDYNIRVGRDYENDYFKLDYPYYEDYPIADGTYNEFSNVSDNYYNLYDSTEGEIDFWWDNYYYLDGEYLLWEDENLTAAFNLEREKDFVVVELSSGEISKNSVFETNFYWVDGDGLACVVSGISMQSIPARYEGDQSTVGCSWDFEGDDCPNEIRWETNEGPGGSWITLPFDDKNDFGINCSATQGHTKALNLNIEYFDGLYCKAFIFGSGSGYDSDYVQCGVDSNISDHTARCALYKNGAFKASSSTKTAVCKEKILLGLSWFNPLSDFTEQGIDRNIIVEGKTICTDGYCGDVNSFLEWCKGLECSDWQDVNNSSGEIILVEGINPVQADLNEAQFYDLNWVIKIDLNELNQDYELRLRTLSEFAPQETTSGTDRTITTGNPPITSSDVNENWQNFDANVHLTCLDVNGVGCDTTYFRIDLDGGYDVNFSDWFEYDSNILITIDGNIGVQFYSVDLVENTESFNEVFVLINKTQHYLLTENFLPNPSNSAKNLVRLLDGNLSLSYCYYNETNFGDAYFMKSGDGLNWNTPIQINSLGNCSGYYSENEITPFRTGEGGITSAINSFDDLLFLFTEWNGLKAWTKILYANQTWSNETLISENAGKSPQRDTLNITVDSNNSINYIITQKSQ